MFDFTEAEEEKIINTFFTGENKDRLIDMPSKQKKRYIALVHISKQFLEKEKYTENEVNDILERIYPDFVTLRRYLIDYRLLKRETDGSAYWLNK